MGLTYIDAQVAKSRGAKQRPLRFLVDSGATYSLLPLEVWKELRLEPTRAVDAVLADGTVLQRGVSECRISILDREANTPVILGEEGDEPLLGVITLENLGLMLNPYSRTLQQLKVRI